MSFWACGLTPDTPRRGGPGTGGERDRRKCVVVGDRQVPREPVKTRKHTVGVHETRVLRGTDHIPTKEGGESERSLSEGPTGTFLQGTREGTSGRG